MRSLLFKGYIGFSLLRQSLNTNKLIQMTDTNEKIRFIDNQTLPIMKKALAITGAKITVTGTENVPTDEAVLFVGNHQGNMDIPLLYTSSPQTMGFVAKKEMEKLPVLGTWMKERRCLFMDRENPRETLKTISEAVRYLKDGHSMAIFPEGTRSKNPEMGEFRPGSLRIALKSGVKVIPVTISDSYKLMEEKGKITPANVSIHFSKPIDSKNFTDTATLSDSVLFEIQKNFFK